MSGFFENREKMTETGWIGKHTKNNKYSSVKLLLYIAMQTAIMMMFYQILLLHLMCMPTYQLSAKLFVNGKNLWPQNARTSARRATWTRR